MFLNDQETATDLLYYAPIAKTVEGGAIWWSDGSPHYNRKRAIDSPCAAWYVPQRDPL